MNAQSRHGTPISHATGAPTNPRICSRLLGNHEAYELGPRYCVRQAHAEWSEIDGQIMWDQEENHHFWILSEAKQRYEERKRALAEKGFIYSEMDLI